eukprot:13330332-Heterocapsa_arctica.AAC.1
MRGAQYGASPARPFGVGPDAPAVGLAPPVPAASAGDRRVPIGFSSGVYDSLLKPETRRSGAGEATSYQTNPALLEMAQAVRDGPQTWPPWPAC